MSEKVNGFDLDVTIANGSPRVRVRMGEHLILDTDALSCVGLQKLAGALERASKIAATELDRYWYAQQQQIRRANARVDTSTAVTGEVR